MYSTSTPTRRRSGLSKGEQREAEILEAARVLLADRSLSALTIDDITSAAGISRTTFYFYFPTKQAVVMTLLEGLWDEFGTTHGWLSSQGLDPILLDEHHRLVVEVWRKHQAILQCTTGVVDYEPLEEWISRAHDRFVTALAAKIERDQASSAAPKGVAPTALATIVSELRDKRFPELAALSGARLDQNLADLTEVVLRIIYGVH